MAERQLVAEMDLDSRTTPVGRGMVLIFQGPDLGLPEKRRPTTKRRAWRSTPRRRY